MARVLLIQPSAELLYPGASLSVFPSLPLAYVSAVLKRQGHFVVYRDVAALDGDLDALVRSERFDFALINHQRYYTYMAYMTPVTGRLAAWIKHRSPATVVVTADPYASYDPRGACDLTCPGEVEASFPAMVAGQSPLPLVADLDELPLPDPEVLCQPTAGTRGRYMGAAPIQMMTTWGCPYDCEYCLAIQVHGRKSRRRSVASVAAEARFWKEQYGRDYIIFWDETFTQHRSYVLELCDRLEPLGIAWSCNTRVDRVDPELLTRMAAAGCRSILFGVERTDTGELATYARSKQFRLEQYQEVFAMARDARITPVASLMFGLQEDRLETLEAEVERIATLGPCSVYVRPVVALPSTPLYSRLVAEGVVPPADTWGPDQYPDEPNGFPTICQHIDRRTLVQFCREARLRLRGVVAAGGMNA